MKNVVITGAGRGIGLALTKIFLANGYTVLATYRNKNSAKELLSLAGVSKGLVTVVADVSRSDSLSQLQAAMKQLGPIDILINNSGVIGAKENSLAEFDIDKSVEVFQVNTFGPMRVTKIAQSFLRVGGTIAHISSMMGSITDNASGGNYDYRMSKAALNMFNSCLSKEFKNSTCLVLHPGWVQTEMGGAGANLKVEDSAVGLYNVIVNAKPSQTGQFIDFRGEPLPW